MTTAAAIDEAAALQAEIDAIRRRNVHRMGLEHADSIRVEKLEARIAKLRGESVASPEFAAVGIGMAGPAASPLQPFDHAKARKRKKKRTAADVVPNPCYCDKHAFVMTGKLPKKHTRARTAYDLCTRGPTPEDGTTCQVYQLFRTALVYGGHPADWVRRDHGFEPTADDREHLDWVCLLNAREWLYPWELAKYAGLPAGTVGRLVDRFGRGVPQLEGVEITETTFAEFLTTYRSRA